MLRVLRVLPAPQVLRVFPVLGAAQAQVPVEECLIPAQEEPLEALALAAQELGIGSTWVMHFIPEAIKEEFMLPDNYEPVSLLVMGYPAEDAKPFPGHTSVKPIAETVQYNSFS